jgi:hypothetical protein
LKFLPGDGRLGAEAAGGSGAGEPGGGEADGLEEGDDEGGGGFVAGTGVAVDGGGVEVDGVAGTELVNGLAVLDGEAAFHDVEELEATVLVEVVVDELAGLELGEVGVELAIGDEVAEALEVVARIGDAGLREAHTVGGTVDAEEGEGDGAEEVIQILAEDHGDAGEVAQGGNDAAGFELGEEAGGEAGVAAEFGEAEGRFLAEGADAQADAFLGDEGFDGVATNLYVRVVLRGSGNVLFFGKKNDVRSGRGYWNGFCGLLLVSHWFHRFQNNCLQDRCIESMYRIDREMPARKWIGRLLDVWGR